MSAFEEAMRNSKPIEPDPEPIPQADSQERFKAAFIPKNGLDRRWDVTDPPERDWLMRPLLPAGRVGALLGQGGSGKTRLMLSLAIALAFGGNWFGFSATEPGAVLIIGSEDELTEAHRRLAQEIKRLPADLQALAWGNIYFESRVGIPSLITETNPVTREVERTIFLYHLVEAAKLIPNLKAIFLDPLSRMRGGEENASQDTTRLVEAAEFLASETGAAVLLVHHIGKAAATTGGGDSQHAARGSSALVDGCRYVWNLSALSAAEVKKLAVPDGSARDYAKFSNSKNNYARKFDDIFLDMRGEIRQVVLSPQGTVGNTGFNVAILEKLKGIIQDKAKLGVRFSRRSFVDNFAGVQKGLGLSKAALDLTIQEAIGLGDLIVHQRTGRGGGQELYLPGEKISLGADHDTF